MENSPPRGACSPTVTEARAGKHKLHARHPASPPSHPTATITPPIPPSVCVCVMISLLAPCHRRLLGSQLIRNADVFVASLYSCVLMTSCWRNVVDGPSSSPSFFVCARADFYGGRRRRRSSAPLIRSHSVCVCACACARRCWLSRGSTSRFCLPYGVRSLLHHPLLLTRLSPRCTAGRGGGGGARRRAQEAPAQLSSRRIESSAHVLDSFSLYSLSHRRTRTAGRGAASPSRVEPPCERMECSSMAPRHSCGLSPRPPPLRQQLMWHRSGRREGGKGREAAAKKSRPTRRMYVAHVMRSLARPLPSLSSPPLGSVPPNKAGNNLHTS